VEVGLVFFLIGNTLRRCYIVWLLLDFFPDESNGNLIQRMTNVKVWVDGNVVYTFPSNGSLIAETTIIQRGKTPEAHLPQTGRIVKLTRDSWVGDSSGGFYLNVCEVEVWGE
jgi:hypothetical protein